MRKALPSVAVALLVLAACSKDKDPVPQPDPTPVVRLQRTFTYPAASQFNNVQGYSQRTLQSEASIQPSGGLYLGFHAVEGEDQIELAVPQASLTADLRGIYILRGQTAPQGTATAWYTHYLSNAAGTLQSRRYPVGLMQGQLTITGYDAQRQLLSGTYRVQMPDVADPNDASVGSSGPRCNVEVEGSFENLKLTKQ